MGYGNNEETFVENYEEKTRHIGVTLEWIERERRRVKREHNTVFFSFHFLLSVICTSLKDPQHFYDKKGQHIYKKTNTTITIILLCHTRTHTERERESCLLYTSGEVRCGTSLFDF